jgi:hypothetical protein
LRIGYALGDEKTEISLRIEKARKEGGRLCFGNLMIWKPVVLDTGSRINA